MRRILRSAASIAATLAVAACNANTASLPAAVNGQSVASSRSAVGQSVAPQSRYSLPAGVHRACTDFRPGYAHCEVLVRDDKVGPDVAGYYASTLETAYNLPSSTDGSGQTVAIVDAYDNPNVATDLAEYRSFMGLPTGNFTKYNQDGDQGNYPAGNADWGVEIALDVEMVSASCPLCNIILVEANSASFSDLGAAENEAVTLGATIVSNSYSGSGVTKSDYDHKKVTILASAGDDGYGIADPADLGSVVAVGGTTLTKSGGSGRGFTETVWTGSGSGCSTDAKPKWQHDSGCKFRTANDVAAIADPNTGVAEYDTYQEGGWFVVGGTSVSSPFLAGVFGLAGNATKQNGGKTFWEKKHESDLYDVTSGSNGHCSVQYLCNGEVGYDGPTGWGTPNGIGAF